VVPVAAAGAAVPFTAVGLGDVGGVVTVRDAFRAAGAGPVVVAAAAVAGAPLTAAARWAFRVAWAPSSGVWATTLPRSPVARGCASSWRTSGSTYRP